MITLLFAIIYLLFIISIFLISFFLVTRLQAYSIRPNFTRSLIVVFVIVTLIIIVINATFFFMIPFDEMMQTTSTSIQY